MDKSTVLRFIEKTIEKTKSEELHWEILDERFHLKNPAPDYRIIPENMPNHAVISNACYIADYKAGHLLFMTFAPMDYLNPPRNCGFALRIQDEVTEHAIEIDHYGLDSKIDSQLIRLYNLIDSLVPQPRPKLIPAGPLDASSLIQDFLNS